MYHCKGAGIVFIDNFPSEVKPLEEKGTLWTSLVDTAVRLNWISFFSNCSGYAFSPYTITHYICGYNVPAAKLFCFPVCLPLVVSQNKIYQKPQKHHEHKNDPRSWNWVRQHIYTACFLLFLIPVNFKTLKFSVDSVLTLLCDRVPLQG